VENPTTETRSEEVQEILSYSPGWILRWGVASILSILLLMLFVSWFVKYPDIISSRITITNSAPPVGLVARTSGKLSLYVGEGDSVKNDAYLGAIENPANVQDVVSLREELVSIRAVLTDPAKRMRFKFNRNLMVGELQPEYSNFLQCLTDDESFLRTHYHSRKTASIQRQISLCEKLTTKLTDQKEILAKELELASQKHNGDKALFDKNLISRVEWVSSENAYLTQKYALENAESNIISNNIQLQEFEKIMLDIDQQFRDTERTLLVALRESLKKLLSQITAWEQKYVLKSPIDGHVSFFKFRNNNQFVNSGNEVMTVFPASNNMIGRIFLPQAGAGKLKVGQRVNIQLDNYPYREFGIVYGEVNLISPVSRENQYCIDLRLPRGLRTSYDRILEFKHEMQGNADIITEDLRLIQRLFNQLNSILKNST
jgi:hypothetical protein